MTAGPEDSGRRRPLGERLPLLYSAFAHLCLALACAALALDPAAYAGFFYHPPMIALVHLVTLGWISGSILAALQGILPAPPRGRAVARLDAWTFVAYALGATGIVSHFWIGELSGVGWSGLLLTLVFLRFGHQAVRSARGTGAAPGVGLLVVLAFVNLVLAAAAGALFGFNRWTTFLPGSTLVHALAHAHLAVLGWATMMVFAAVYHLRPVLAPGAAASRRRVLWGALLLETGVLGIVAGLHVEGPALALAAAVTIAGLLVFLFDLGGTLRGAFRRARPDLGAVQVVQALAYLVASAVLGVLLTLSPLDAEGLRRVWLYGVFGLLGFLGQMVAGLAHLFRSHPVPAGALPDRSASSEPPTSGPRGQAVSLALWTAGVPLLAAGLYGDLLGWTRLGAGLLLAATAAGGWSLRAARRREPPGRDRPLYSRHGAR